MRFAEAWSEEKIRERRGKKRRQVGGGSLGIGTFYCLLRRSINLAYFVCFPYVKIRPPHRLFFFFGGGGGGGGGGFFFFLEGLVTGLIHRP